MIGNFPRRMTIRDLHVAFKIPRTKMFTTSDKVKPNTGNTRVFKLGSGEA
jgi:hypothetical protein